MTISQSLKETKTLHENPGNVERNTRRDKISSYLGVRPSFCVDDVREL